MINKRDAITVDGKITASAETPINVRLGEFRKMRQGVSTNTLTKTGDKNKKTDKYTNATTIEAKDKSSGLTITFKDYSALSGLRTSAYQLLDAVTVKFTETSMAQKHVEITLDEYMEMRKLKDKKEARKQAEADAKTLICMNITFYEARHGADRAFYSMNLFEGGGINKNNVIVFDFSEKFKETLSGYPYMHVPPLLWQLNNKRNPNSYYLLRKISELKHMNAGKTNEDLIAVQTLLACSPHFVSYEEVMAGNKNVTSRIIEPFERDMDALEDALTWEYCHSRGEPLTQKEIDKMTYSVFAGSLVKITWHKYPIPGKVYGDEEKSEQKTGGKGVLRKKARKAKAQDKGNEKARKPQHKGARK